MAPRHSHMDRAMMSRALGSGYLDGFPSWSRGAPSRPITFCQVVQSGLHFVCASHSAITTVRTNKASTSLTSVYLVEHMLQMHSRPPVFTPSSANRHYYRRDDYYCYPPKYRSKDDERQRRHMSWAGETIEPHENDVLMGRGGKNNRHSGNEKLRQMAKTESDNYRESTKKGKSQISRQLVQQMLELDPPARYVQLRESSTGCSTAIDMNLTRSAGS